MGVIYKMSYEPTNWKKGDKVTSTRLNKIENGIQGNDTEISNLKEDLQDIDERVEALEEGGTGGISMTAVNLLNTILSEAVYGTDQTANIALLKKELSNVAPVSISAVLDGTALAGQSYSELSFTVTATFDDESTAVVDNYTVVTTGTVTAGSNTVTIKYRGVTTTCKFTAEQVMTYSITYNLTDVTSSNDTTVVVENSYYSTTLSIPEDYGFNGCTVTMGGVDITGTAFGNMEILITEVTGDVVITASATEIVPITDTTQAHITTRIYSYSDNGQNFIDQNYYGGELYYTKHNFKKASTVTVTIANNTDSDITAKVFAGEIPTNVDALNEGGTVRYKPNLTNVEVWNAKKITPSSNVIPAGGYVSADIDITAGRRIAVALPNGMTTLDVTMIGAYDPIDYSTEYDLLAITALGGATTTGRTYYSDAGTTTVKNGSDVWGYEFYNNSYQWDTSKAYHIVKRYEPQDNTVKFTNAFIEGFGTETRTKTVYNCNSLCDSDHWNGERYDILPFFDYIGTIQPLSGYPVYTTFVHNDNCKVYVKEVSA